MALFTRMVVTLVLASFVGACASKSARVEIPSDHAVLQAELELTREKREELKKEELELRKQKPVPTEELIRVRAEQIRLSERETVILDQLEGQGDSATKRARRQIQREANLNKRNERDIAKALANSALVGCNPATVTVMPLGQNRNAFNIFPPTLIVRVLNRGNTPITIETAFRGYGPVVENLCAGGSITVSFQLRLEDPQMVNIPMMITTKLPNGRIVEESRVFYLNKWQANYNRVDNQIWSVDLGNR